MKKTLPTSSFGAEQTHLSYTRTQPKQDRQRLTSLCDVTTYCLAEVTCTINVYFISLLSCLFDSLPSVNELPSFFTTGKKKTGLRNCGNENFKQDVLQVSFLVHLPTSEAYQATIRKPLTGVLFNGYRPISALMHDRPCATFFFFFLV